MPRISELDDGGALQAGDELVVARSGVSYRIAGSEFGSGSVVTAYTVTLTPTEIRNLNIAQGSPVEIVPAPGSGKALIPFAFAFVGNPGTTPYRAEDSQASLVAAYGSDPPRPVAMVMDNEEFPASPPPDPSSLLGSTVRRFLWQPVFSQFGSVSPPNLTEQMTIAEANCPLVLYSSVLWSGGGVTAAHVAVGGSGYAPGDQFRVISPENTYQGGLPPSGDCQCTVLTVDGGGGVVTFSIDGGGMNFIAGTTYATQHDTGGGDDALTVHVDTAPEGDGTLDVTTYYSVFDLSGGAASFGGSSSAFSVPVTIDPADQGAAPATVTTALSGANNDLVFTALGGGTGGNDLTVEYVAPDPDNTLYVFIVGSAISIVPSSDSGGTITSTAQDVIDALNGNLFTADRLFAETAPGNDGTGVITVMAPLALAGGVTGLEIAPVDDEIAPLTIRGRSETSKTPLLEAITENGYGVRVEADGAIRVNPSGGFSEAAMTFERPGTSHYWQFLANDGSLLAKVNADGTFDVPALLLGGFPAQADLSAITVFPNAGQVSDLIQLYQDDGVTLRLKVDKDGGLHISPSGGVAPLTLTGLPTADPHVVGQVWNSTGTLKVSAG